MIISPRLLFASTLLLCVGSAAGGLSFHAEEGTRVVRTLDFELEMEMESMSMTVGGNEVPSDHTDGAEMTMRESTHLVVIDEYGPLEEGRPATLRRTYEELGGETGSTSSGPGGDAESSSDKSSDLEGATVLFTWDADEEEYSAEFEEGGDADLLDGLEEDLDLRGFLPAGEVAEGDTWQTDLEPFRRVFEPGGDLSLVSEDAARAEVDALLTENLEGEVRITYIGTRDEDGVEVAVLQLEIEAETEAQTSAAGPGDGEIEQLVTMEFELEGELTWALEAGHLHAFEVAGDLTAEMTNTSDFNSGDQVLEFVQTMSFEGEVSYALSVRAE